MPLTNDGKIKEGLRDHALFQMDGRIWIEAVFPPKSDASAKIRERMLERGWMKMISHNDLIDLVNLTNESSKK